MLCLGAGVHCPRFVLKQKAISAEKTLSFLRGQYNVHPHHYFILGHINKLLLCLCASVWKTMLLKHRQSNYIINS